jgi:hypothetical protein
MKILLSWLIALIISVLIIWMFWTLIFTMADFWSKFFTDIISWVLMVIIAFPIQLVIRKKLFKK